MFLVRAEELGNGEVGGIQRSTEVGFGGYLQSVKHGLQRSYGSWPVGAPRAQSLLEELESTIGYC